MTKKILYLTLLISILLTACTPSDEDIDKNKSTIAQELDPAKSFYAANGASFKYRVYQSPPTEGYTENLNYHTAEAYKIIDNQGVFSVISKYAMPAIELVGYGAILNCKGDYNHPDSTNKVTIYKSQYDQVLTYDEYEIDMNNTRLLTYNYTNGSHGETGFDNIILYVNNPVFFQGAISSRSNRGYMHTLNHANFMLSMGYNSNSGRPTLYRYNPANYTWIGDPVSQIEWVPGSNTNIPLTNDASKAGNTDKVFWAYLSYTTSLANGKINILSYNGSSFSDVTSLDGIGSIGTGWATVNTITLYKNPTNLNNPYMVVRHSDAEILDIYKFNGTAIEVVKTGITIPSTIALLPGDSKRVIKDIAFSGNNVYIIFGNDKNLYKLSGNSFEIEKPNLTVTDDRISALESTPAGILFSIVKTIQSKPLAKIVSDIVFIAND
jgi:hypothetical protein